MAKGGEELTQSSLRAQSTQSTRGKERSGNALRENGVPGERLADSPRARFIVPLQG